VALASAAGLPIAALSAISGGMGRVSTGSWRLALALAGAVALAACSRGAATPEEAYQRLAQAVAARDAGKLFDALDLDTRWSWMSIQRAQRESYDIILSNFPEGSERERHLRRCEAGALSENARALFVRQLEAPAWTELAAALPATGGPVVLDEGRRVQRAGSNGRMLVFRRPSERGGWGFAGLADAAEQIKRRSLADLDLIRTSAADYERAATRRAP
jgi:hypothetical protein